MSKSGKLAYVSIMAATLSLGVALPATADLTICNKTGYLTSVAIGYQEGENWVSEGWWNIEGGDCAIVLEGDLQLRYYYAYAEHDEIGGGWSGDYTFCTSDNKFTILGDTNCEARGYRTTGFFQIDTGETALDYTQNLVDN
jgi:uncharacterized membrane protein